MKIQMRLINYIVISKVFVIHTLSNVNKIVNSQLYIEITHTYYEKGRVGNKSVANNSWVICLLYASIHVTNGRVYSPMIF